MAEYLWQNPSSPSPPVDPKEYSYPPLRSCDKLITALRARKHQQSPTLLTDEPVDIIPLVILAFDEAHTLTDREGVREGAWSNFSELRRVLDVLHRLQLFSLFLSTTGRISQFTSSKDGDGDVSGRIMGSHLDPTQPFIDLGFVTWRKSLLTRI